MKKKTPYNTWIIDNVRLRTPTITDKAKLLL